MKAINYTVVLAYDAGERVYNVSVPALPGCFTWGRTKRQALTRAREAIKGYLEVLQDSGDPIPKEAGLHRIRVG
jgi:predicted RNase H-like HicB family nuclease